MKRLSHGILVLAIFSLSVNAFASDDGYFHAFKLYLERHNFICHGSDINSTFALDTKEIFSGWRLQYMGSYDFSIESYYLIKKISRSSVELSVIYHDSLKPGDPILYKRVSIFTVAADRMSVASVHVKDLVKTPVNIGSLEHPKIIYQWVLASGSDYVNLQSNSKAYEYLCFPDHK